MGMASDKNNMEVSWNRATPSHHPFIVGIFPNKNHPAFLGYPYDGNLRIWSPKGWHKAITSCLATLVGMTCATRSWQNMCFFNLWGACTKNMQLNVLATNKVIETRWCALPLARNPGQWDTYFATCSGKHISSWCDQLAHQPPPTTPIMDCCDAMTSTLLVYATSFLRSLGMNLAGRIAGSLGLKLDVCSSYDFYWIDGWN